MKKVGRFHISKPFLLMRIIIIIIFICRRRTWKSSRRFVDGRQRTKGRMMDGNNIIFEIMVRDSRGQLKRYGTHGDRLI
jgi:hypothetical protein